MCVHEPTGARRGCSTQQQRTIHTRSDGGLKHKQKMLEYVYLSFVFGCCVAFARCTVPLFVLFDHNLSNAREVCS